MKHIMLMGYVYRLSERNYLRVLRALAADKSFDLDALGTQVCAIDLNVTDMDAGDAQHELDWRHSVKAAAGRS
jgi:hypothetical protein